jgi:hypothetical protein
MRIYKIIFSALIFCINFSIFSSNKIIPVYYQASESIEDVRNLYHWELLQIALDKTEKEYGIAKLQSVKKIMNELRIFKKLISGSYDIDVMVRPTSIENEKLLEPVRIPLDKGLLGYRIFLIDKKNQRMFFDITSVEQLKKLMLGQGRDWNDVAIYEYNNFNVITVSLYESLFEMLIKNRFDFFPRGVLEIYLEYEDRKDKMSNLYIEESIVLYYPFVRYFWFSNNEKGRVLHKRVTKGLELMIKDGTFNSIFNKYNKKELERFKIKGRKLFKINNPFIPAKTPLDRSELWYDPFK